MPLCETFQVLHSSELMQVYTIMKFNEKINKKLPRRIAVQEFFIPYQFPINPP